MSRCSSMVVNMQCSGNVYSHTRGVHAATSAIATTCSVCTMAHAAFSCTVLRVTRVSMTGKCDHHCVQILTREHVNHPTTQSRYSKATAAPRVA